VVAAQAAAGAKTNEVPVAAVVPGQLDLHGKVVTADALHTVRATARLIREGGGEFVLPVKENRRSLFDAIDALPWKDVPVAHAATVGDPGEVDLLTGIDSTMARQIGRSRWSSAWWSEVAWRLADHDVEVNLGSAYRVHLYLHGVGDGRPLRRERAVHDGADLAREVSGAHHFRDRLVQLPGERGGYLGLNSVLGNRRRSADADVGAATSDKPASDRHRDDEGPNMPSTFKHAITRPRLLVLAYHALIAWVTVLVKRD
jgi:hypothetical protein